MYDSGFRGEDPFDKLEAVMASNTTVELWYRCARVVCVLVPVMIAGCMGTAIGPSLYTARFQDCGGPNPPARDSFGPGEVPAMVTRYCNGQTIAVEILDLRSGNQVFKDARYVAQSFTTCWIPLSDLPEGSYTAYLSIGGMVVRTCTFSVSR